MACNRSKHGGHELAATVAGSSKHCLKSAQFPLQWMADESNGTPTPCSAHCSIAGSSMPDLSSLFGWPYVIGSKYLCFMVLNRFGRFTHYLLSVYFLTQTSGGRPLRPIPVLHIWAFSYDLRNFGAYAIHAFIWWAHSLFKQHAFFSFWSVHWTRSDHPSNSRQKGSVALSE